MTYVISLIDRASAPLRGIRQQVGALGQTAKNGAQQVAMGTAAMWAAGQAIKNGLEPAIEMRRALASVEALDVTKDGLKQLQNAALDFSMRYGTSATEIVGASYDIQSAISGLSADELTGFTTTSALVAKATKADTATMTNYMGTMYGIFKQTADGMGKVKWAEKIGGQTAYAANLFKSDGESMSQAFTALGAAAQTAGRTSAEQFAILGQLQSTMSGSEAGTKYKAFLAGVGNAQKTLGMNFTDATGQMKSMPEILDMLHKRFGNISKVADSDLLKKAFGTDEAVSLIKLLIKDTDGLKRSISEIDAIDGLDGVKRAAATVADPWERATAAINAVKISLGSALLPVLEPVLLKMVALSREAVNWLNKFRNIARWIGIITASVVGATAAGAAFSVVLGSLKMAGAGIRLAGIFTGITPAFKLLANGAVAVLRFTGALKFLRTSLFAARIAMLSFGGSMAAVTAPIWGLVALIALVIAAVVVTVIKFWNPIKAFFSGFVSGFMQAAQKSTVLQSVIAALGPVFSAVCSVVSWLWNGIKSLCGWFSELLTPIQYTEAELATFSSAGSSAGNIVAAAFDIILYPINLIISAVSWLIKIWPDVVAGWTSVCAAFSEFSFADVFKSGVESIGQLFSGLWESIKQQFYGVYNSIVEQLNKLPGVEIELMGKTPDMTAGATATTPPGGMAPAALPPGLLAIPGIAPIPGAPAPAPLPAAAVPASVLAVPGVAPVSASPAFASPSSPPSPAPALTGGRLDPAVAGVSSKSTKTTNNINNSRSVGSVNVYVQQMQNEQQIAEIAEMAAG
ncbi:TPA: phage tail tape measure protein [Salmonella enterica subsp. salamae serovar 16:m,t:e,n,x]|nr:phage tail tape measure protein [Salmonella enterica subsp. salamae serovar 16:m,t:e,n,x]